MHARTKPRPELYVWITSISKLLSGEANCLWSVWFRAHHYAAKLETDFDASAWQIEHAARVSRTAARYEAEGYTVGVEHQNAFTLNGKRGTLAGPTPSSSCVRTPATGAPTRSPGPAPNRSATRYSSSRRCGPK